MKELFRVSDMTCGYNGVIAVQGASVRIGCDEIVVLLGPNGAGKTSFLLGCMGLIPRQRGSVWFENCDVSRVAPYNLARLGVSFVPDSRALFQGLSCRTNLRLAQRRGGLSIDDVCGIFPKLAPRLELRAGSLSGGEQQMLAIARALISRPKLLIVDEMSMGLAPIITQELMGVVRSAVGEVGSGALLVEQHVPLALASADRAYVMVHSQIVLEADCDDLIAEPHRLEAAYLGAGADVT